MFNILRKPVLIDTDIGDDIDDAFALCIAMQSPEIQLVGVTTVFKNTLCRAKIARRLLDLGGFSQVPVYSGIGIPTNNTQVYGRPIHVDELPKTYQTAWDDTEIPADTDGPGFIIRTLENSPEPVTIVTMGALTNIADVLRRRPDLADKISLLSIMGGSYVKNMCEYNFTCDPEAASFVLKSSVPMRAVGVDITFECFLGDEDLKRLWKIDHPCLQMLLEMKDSWNGSVFLHDPLALLTAFHPDFVTLKKTIYHVECGNGMGRGICVPLSDHNWNMDASQSPLEVAVGVHAEAVVRECMNRLNRF